MGIVGSNENGKASPPRSVDARIRFLLTADDAGWAATALIRTVVPRAWESGGLLFGLLLLGPDPGVSHESAANGPTKKPV